MIFISRSQSGSNEPDARITGSSELVIPKKSIPENCQIRELPGDAISRQSEFFADELNPIFLSSMMDIEDGLARRIDSWTFAVTTFENKFIYPASIKADSRYPAQAGLDLWATGVEIAEFIHEKSFEQCMETVKIIFSSLNIHVLNTCIPMLDYTAELESLLHAIGRVTTEGILRSEFYIPGYKENVNAKMVRVKLGQNE